MSTVKQYRVFCTTGGIYEFAWGTTAPTVCPSDGGPIDTSLTTVVSEISNDVVNTGAQYDAFGRLRVSELNTILDLKQTGGQLPLLIDQVQSGTASSTYNTNESSTTLATSAASDYAISQSFQRGQYQSGKSALVELTFSGMQSETNIIKRVGYFNSSTTAPYTANLDGIFLQSDDTGIYLKVYRNGTEIDSAEQANWLDPCDGTSNCPAVDWSKAQIFSFDFQWLGVGRVAFYLTIGEMSYLIHVFPHSNILDKVYMAQSNHSVRWEIRQTGAGSGSMNYICSAFHTEGATNVTGKQFSQGTGVNTVNANISGTFYAIAGIRLANINAAPRVDVISTTLIPTTTDALVWQLRLNPTVAGTFTYNTVTNSLVQAAVGDTASNPSSNTVTGGTILESGYVNRGSSEASASEFFNGIRIGASINGTLDTLVLCVSPVSGYSNLDVAGSINWFESE